MNEIKEAILFWLIFGTLFIIVHNQIGIRERKHIEAMQETRNCEEIKNESE